MENPCLKLLDQLENKLIEIEQNHNSRLDRCSEKIKLCQRLTIELRGHYLEHKFSNLADEINFFKKIKPRLFSELYFQLQVFEYYKLRPKGSLKAKKIFLNNCLDKASALISEHCEFRNYHLMNATHLDQHYFIKQEFNPVLHGGLKFPSDPEFSSPADPTLSCLMAAERCVQFIKNELYALKNPNLDPSWEFMKFLDWKGSKTDLVELIYSLHSANILSGDLKHTFQLAEKAFNIDIGNFYRIYSDIKLKKNPTNLLDSLKTAFLEKMEKEIHEN
ncbi:MAG: RteC domain-containing protein [Fulvivirga sp.]